MKRALRCTLALLMFMAAVFRLCFLPVWISGESMEPTFRSGTIRLMKRIAISSTPLQRYELVVARSAGELVVKRVVGFSGEWVRMSNGVIYVDGCRQVEPFPVRRGNWTIKPGLVEFGKVLLMGDNRELPIQSFYMVPESAIIARAFPASPILR